MAMAASGWAPVSDDAGGLARGARGAPCSVACAASGAARHSVTSPRASLALIRRPARLRRRRLLPGGRRRRRRRLDEGPDRELGLEQRADRVGQHFLRLLLRWLEDHFLRHDDAWQAGDVGQELAEIVVMAEDLEAVPVGVEWLAGLDRPRLEPPDR